ncbi:MAG: hypothetical protein ACXQTW_07615 [Candidatus Methanospirareceae archaeon]
MNKEKREKIAAGKAFQMMNMFLNRPCARYASEIREILPQINRIALYYRAIQRNLSGSEKAMVELFLREHQKVLELLPVFLERKETPYRGLEVIC